MIAVGLAAAIVLFGFSWWAPLVLLAAWGSTHWLLRESGVWRDRNTDEVRNAQRHADYAYRLAVDPPAAKEVRLFGLADWVIDRFGGHRRRLYELQWEATRLRERSVLACLLIVLAANAFVLWVIGEQTIDGRLDLADASVYLQTAVGVGAIAFGGLSWALDGSAAPVVAVLRLEAAMAEAGALPRGGHAGDRAPGPGDPVPRRALHLSRHGPTDPRRLRPHHPGGVVAGDRRAERRRQDHPRQAAVPSVRPAVRRHRGRRHGPARARPRGVAAPAWLPCSRTSCASSGRSGPTSLPAGIRAHRSTPRSRPRWPTPARTASPDSTSCCPGPTTAASTSRAVSGNGSPSPGRWRRCGFGARVVLLDEPTAQLDVRGEAEIFERVLAATRDVHHDPRVPPVLDRAAGRPHLRGRARWGRRDRQPRRS